MQYTPLLVLDSMAVSVPLAFSTPSVPAQASRSPVGLPTVAYPATVGDQLPTRSETSTGCRTAILLAGVAAVSCISRREKRTRQRCRAVKTATQEDTETETRSTPGPHDLLLRVAKGDVAPGTRTPVWGMRQAGRYMKSFRKFSERYPFRQRSETPDMAVELSLQCWQKYGLDAVIMFSDILTPLPALGIEFDVIRGRGPIVMGDLGRTLEDRLVGPNAIKEIGNSDDFIATHGFVRETLQRLRKETEGKTSLVGFVGAPWTLAAYSVEGGGTKDASMFKKWMYSRPDLVDDFLKRVATSISSYAIFQIESGAQCIQIFDSWAHHMTPEQWKRFACPHVQRIAMEVRAAHPEIPLIYFANGGSSYFRDQVEELKGLVEVLALDQGMRMSEAVKIAEGSGLVIQGNVDPFILRYGGEAEVRDAVRRCIDEAGGPGQHILNLGHGVMQGTPEENMLYFTEEAQTYQG